ncbi:MAG: glycosyltransferase family 4 protein [Pseudonocardia sp.]
MLTRTKNVAAIEAALTPEQRARCRVIAFDLPPAVQNWKRRIRGSTQVYYTAWQWRARRFVRRLHALHRYDLAHHVTFANDWTMVALKGIDDLPFVWGPIGGRTRTPLSLLHYHGVKGSVAEAVRSVAGAAGRALSGNASARAAALVVAANSDVQNGYRFHARRLVVEPSAAVDPNAEVWHSDVERLGPVVGIGRLVPWKGWSLALEAIARIDEPDVKFVLLGDGPDRRRLESRARRLGVADRVEFLGALPREDVAAILRSARVLLFPSFHDSSPWAVAEALMAGCPVVSLDLGGVPELVAGAGGTVVPHAGPDLAGRLAEAVLTCCPPHSRTAWSSDRLPALMSEWYASAARARVTP